MVDCKSWLSLTEGTRTRCLAAVLVFNCVGLLVLEVARLYSCTVYVLEEAPCSLSSNSSVELLHPDRKAGVPNDTLNLGVKFI